MRLQKAGFFRSIFQFTYADNRCTTLKAIVPIHLHIQIKALILKKKTELKVARIRQVSEFCNKIMSLLTWNRAYGYIKI